MSFPIFVYSSAIIENVISASKNPLDVLKKLQQHIGKEALPDYLLRYVELTMPNGVKSAVVHESSSIAGYKDGNGTNLAKIERTRGFFGANQMQKDKYPQAIHHFKIFYNAKNNARMFYKFDGGIKFIKNIKSV
jgi:hypothetical protein